ncbi:DUF6916 family protein [Nocardioides rubriscoriae]|uniref:DUF6916 family protein n=1 Tax=Nocardioides rubriscoriae TaxID=642762 RepID=UPI0011DF3C56|nr:hypothetical protein [Nocardioides rubriscoriae]
MTPPVTPPDATPGAPGSPRATRRTVVAAAGLTGVALAVPVSLRLVPGLLGGSAAAPAPLDRAAFAPHVGGTFRAVLAATTRELELVEVADLDDRADLVGDPESFAVRFRGARDAGALEQGTYELARPGFAATPVFLVPSGPGGPSTLTAVFNRVEAPR